MDVITLVFQKQVRKHNITVPLGHKLLLKYPSKTVKVTPTDCGSLGKPGDVATDGFWN